MKPEFEKEKIEKLIVGFIDRTLSPEDEKTVIDWIQASDENRRFFYEIKKTHVLLRKSTFDAEKSWRRLEFKLNRNKVASLWRRRFLYFVAAASVVVCVMLGYTFSEIRAPHGDFVCETSDTPIAVTLPDGSSVHLGAYSTLQYTPAFGKSQRRVALSGEGFFEVKKQAHCPFVVEAGVNEVIVKGTKFNVECYSPDNILTTLVEGSVEFVNLPSDYRYCIKPGEQLFYDNLTHEGRVSHVRCSVATFTDSKYEFDNTQLRQILSKLGYIHRIRIVCDNEAELDKYYRCVFNTGESLSETLVALERMTGLKLVSKTDTIVVLE